MNAFVTMMKNPDIHEPRNTRNAESQCIRRESLFSAKRKSPRNDDSRKNEKMPSIASGIPMTPPVRRENSDQLVPNWNSIGMPVTTPRRKLIANSFPQKRAEASYTSETTGSDARS